MKYKSFEAAKIANPEEDIFKLDDGSFVTGFWINKNNFGKHTFTRCCAKDHCMSKRDFLEKGYKFVGKDIVLRDNFVETLEETQCKSANISSFNDQYYFVLKAAALTNCPWWEEQEECETPKRVKVEYVNLNKNEEGGKFWEVARDWSEGNREFRFMRGNGDYDKVENDKELLSIYTNDKLLFRVEKEITDRDEFIEKVEAIAEDIASDSEWSFACIAAAMFDSGEFKLTKGE